MTKEEYVKYWLDGAAHDLEAAESLFHSKKYDWCLFIGHLVLEKTLKALYVNTHEENMPPKIHNLLRLAELSGITLTTEQQEFFDDVNEFNSAVRYSDEKEAFYKRCTHEYATPYFTRIKEVYQWLTSLLISMTSSKNILPH